MQINLSVGPPVDIPVDRIFYATCAASTSSAGLATTYTGGVCISNPAGSGIFVVPLWVSSTAVVITAAVTSVGVLAGYAAGGVTVHTTPLLPNAAYIGNANVPIAKADQACTLVGNPTWVLPGLASSGIAAGVWGITYSLVGLAAVPPGGYIATGTSIASASSGHLATIGWAEVRAPG